MPPPTDPPGAALARSAAVAADRIAEIARVTPTLPSIWLSDRVGASVSLKLENLQVTGSFKIRGAANKLLASSAEVAARGYVTASTGNHGLAVAHVAGRLQVPCTVFVPTTVVPGKRAFLEKTGVAVIVAGTDAVESESEARTYAAATDRCYVSPYNDLEVVAGQGTVGIELTRQLQGVDAVLLAVGGGGLIAGVAAALKAVWPEVCVIGCSPAASAVMQASIAAGRVVDMPVGATISDGTAGGIEPGSVTFEMCSALVDDWWAVEEPAIADALLRFVREERMLIEGAAAVPVAALLEHAKDLCGMRVAVVLCGGNLALADFAELIRSSSA